MTRGTARGPVATSRPHPPEGPAWIGGLYALAAFATWGLSPIYWKAVARVGAYAMVAHRALWAFVLLAALLAAGGRAGRALQVLRQPRTRALLLTTALLVTVNWLLYVGAIQAGHVLEASLGYYMNPLVNVLLGVLVLGERLGHRAKVAVLLAGLGVANLVVVAGILPWISLTLAVTFGLYGLLRKTAAVDPLEGLAIETALMLPVALGGLAWLQARGAGVFLAGDAALDVLVVLSGVVTVLPLLWFTIAARRLRYATIGFFQYLAPTLNLLLAVFAYGEPFTAAHALTFSLIGAALALYTYEALGSRPGPEGTRPLPVVPGAGAG